MSAANLGDAVDGRREEDRASRLPLPRARLHIATRRFKKIEVLFPARNQQRICRGLSERWRSPWIHEMIHQLASLTMHGFSASTTGTPEHLRVELA